MLVSSTLFSVRLEMVKVWLFSSKLILRVALDLVLQIYMDQREEILLKHHVEPCRKTSSCAPATFLQVGFNLVDVDLGVQQRGEMSRAGLSGSGHLQVVQLQPEV